jgi:hypothetical protein
LTDHGGRGVVRILRLLPQLARRVDVELGRLAVLQRWLLADMTLLTGTPARIHSIPSVRLLLRNQLAPIMIEKARLAQQPREALAVDDR